MPFTLSKTGYLKDILIWTFGSVEALASKLVVSENSAASRTCSGWVSSTPYFTLEIHVSKHA